MKDRKSMIMVIIIGITISLFLCFNTTVFATTGTVTTSDLRLRKENSTTSSIIALLDENDEVEIISEDGDWYKVKVDGNVGYVNKQYIKVKENSVILNNTSEGEKSEAESNTSENKLPNEESSSQENPSENQENNTQQTDKKQQGRILEDSQIRIIPLINGDIINNAKSGQKYDIISNVGLWSYIQNDEISGWILTEKLSLEVVDTNNKGDETTSEDNKTDENTEKPEESKEENQEDKKEEVQENNTEENKKEDVKEENPETTYSSSKTYYVNGTSVNVRSEANKSSSVVTKLTTNDEVKVTGETGDWYIVTVSGKKGYISKALLSTKKVEVTSRSSNSLQQEQKEQTSNAETKQAETTTASSSSSGEAVVAYAKKFVGYPYVYGKNGPNSFDCSGFVQYVYKHFGYSLSRSSKTQANDGRAVSKSDLQPGDVLIFNNTSNTAIGHVGIYIGNNQFVHASNSRTGVIISSLSTSAYQKRYVGARRILR